MEPSENKQNKERSTLKVSPKTHEWITRFAASHVLDGNGSVGQDEIIRMLIEAYEAPPPMPEDLDEKDKVLAAQFIRWKNAPHSPEYQAFVDFVVAKVAKW